jgi:maleylpyruvate isomerase
VTRVAAEPGNGVDVLLRWMTEGTAVFEDMAARAPLRGPSHLPGWTRAHVVAHVARNADALANLLAWARTGVERPMYASAGQRAAEIEAGAWRAERELAEDLLAADARLAADAAGLPARCWDMMVRTARGRAVPASEVPWMRAREAWVHAIDLNAGLTFAGLPRPVTIALLDDVAAAFASRPDVPPVELRAAGSDRRWALGPVVSGAPAIVTGELASLAAYATGRPAPSPLNAGLPDENLPALPAWL